MRGLEGNFQAQPRVFAHDAVSVTKSDTVNIPNTTERGCCLYIGDSGDVKVKMESGADAISKNVPTGTFLPVLVTRVFSTGTSAAEILALY